MLSETGLYEFGSGERCVIELFAFSFLFEKDLVIYNKT